MSKRWRAEGANWAAQGVLEHPEAKGAPGTLRNRGIRRISTTGVPKEVCEVLAADVGGAPGCSKNLDADACRLRHQVQGIPDNLRLGPCGHLGGANSWSFELVDVGLFPGGDNFSRTIAKMARILQTILALCAILSIAAAACKPLNADQVPLQLR